MKLLVPLLLAGLLALAVYLYYRSLQTQREIRALKKKELQMTTGEKLGRDWGTAFVTFGDELRGLGPFLPYTLPRYGEEITVHHRGVVECGASIYEHRLYFGHQNDSSMIQVATERGAITEMRLFVKVGEVTPTSPEEWEQWLGNDEVIGELGSTVYNVDGTDFIRRGIDAATVEEAEALDNTEPLPEQETYRRDLSDPSPESRQIEYSLFFRQLPGMARSEYLLIRSVESLRGSYIELWRGLDIDPEKNSLTFSIP